MSSAKNKDLLQKLIDAKRLKMYLPIALVTRAHNLSQPRTHSNPYRIKQEGNFLVPLTQLIFHSLFKRFR